MFNATRNTARAATTGTPTIAAHPRDLRAGVHSRAGAVRFLMRGAASITPRVHSVARVGAAGAPPVPRRRGQIRGKVYADPDGIRLGGGTGSASSGEPLSHYVTM